MSVLEHVRTIRDAVPADQVVARAAIGEVLSVLEADEEDLDAFHERAAKGRAARAEALRRAAAAIDRFDVALQFSEPGQATLAQFLHGIHYLRRGWAESASQRAIPTEAPDFRLAERHAEWLALGLTGLIEAARRSQSTWGEQE